MTSSRESKSDEELWADWAQAREEAYKTHRMAVEYEGNRLDRRLAEIEAQYRFLKFPLVPR